MKKMEWVYREILYRIFEKKEAFFTQKNIAEKCGISIGNVNKALKPLEEMNAIEKKPRGFTIINPRKILLYWASIRRLDSDILLKMRVAKDVAAIEKEMPPVMFTAYSGYKFRFSESPSDYSEVIVYGNPDAIRARFAGRAAMKSRPNTIVLKSDGHLRGFRQAPVAQIFVDLWNLNTWYAQEFLNALGKRIEEMASMSANGASGG